MQSISYGIKRDYLSTWGMREAYREILQNFMDYGKYEVQYVDGRVRITNDYIPENLEFLSLGYTNKSTGSRGKHGEGLKMALMIMARNDIDVVVRTDKNKIVPKFVDSPIGEVLNLLITDNEDEQDFFEILFETTPEWNQFFYDIITEEDVIFDDKYYGKIVSRDPGNIYCGGLFVSNVKGIRRAYDINPDHLSLDRDRQTPPSFDVNWNCSKINQAYGKMDVEDLTGSDTMYITDLPEETKTKIVPKMIGNAIEPTYNVDGKDVVIKNQQVKNIMLRDNFFQSTIKKLRKFLLDKMGVYEMLVEFKAKHVHSTDAIQEFDLILERIKQ